MPNRNVFRPYQYVLFFCISLLLTGCAQEPEQSEQLKQAGRSYKAQRDYASLETVHRHLRKGMARSKMEELLGEPDYSPVEGQEYYSSDRRETAGSGKEKEQVKQIDMPVGLIVDYRDEQGELTGQVQTFRLGRIGE